MLREDRRQEGFETTAVHDGETGVREALSDAYAIVVLDVMLPGLSGVEVLRRIRARSRVPVLMLTARGDDVDRIVGLELGADDYVPKPCTPRELVARIRAILRRAEGSDALGPSGPISVGALRLWPERRYAEWDRQAIELTSTSSTCCPAGAQHRAGGEPGRANRVGLAALARFDRAADVHVASLRQVTALADGRSASRRCGAGLPARQGVRRGPALLEVLPVVLGRAARGGVRRESSAWFTSSPSGPGLARGGRASSIASSAASTLRTAACPLRGADGRLGSPGNVRPRRRRRWTRPPRPRGAARRPRAGPDPAQAGGAEHRPPREPAGQ
jgi:DNA-binding response OmpR family regulator